MHSRGDRERESGPTVWSALRIWTFVSFKGKLSTAATAGVEDADVCAIMPA